MEEDAETQEQNPQSPSETKAITVHKTPATAKRGVVGSRRSTRSSSVTSSTARVTRQTRSQAAPEWTVEETLVLISEIAALDEDWLKAFSSYQKWKMISDNCMVRDVVRSSNQCKRRWESLLADYGKIRRWEINSALSSGSYWSLHAAKRKQYRLPAKFDDQVFGSMDAVIMAQEAEIAASDSEELMGVLHEGVKDDDSVDYEEVVHSDESEGSDSDSLVSVPQAKNEAEEVIGMLDAEMADADTLGFADSGFEKTETKISKNTRKTQEMATKLQENAEKIQSILRGELPENVSQGRTLVDLTKPPSIETEFARRQADELIRVFGVLVSNLDQFTELIKESGSDGIKLKSKSS